MHMRLDAHAHLVCVWGGAVLAYVHKAISMTKLSSGTSRNSCLYISYQKGKYVRKDCVNLTACRNSGSTR